MKNTATIVLSLGAVGLLMWYLLRHAATSATTVAGAMAPPPVGMSPNVSAGTASLVAPETADQVKQPLAPIANENPLQSTKLPVLGIPSRLPVGTAFPSGAMTTGPSSLRTFTKAFSVNMA